MEFFEASVKSNSIRIFQMRLVNVVERVFQIARGKPIRHRQILVEAVSAVARRGSRNLAFVSRDELEHFSHERRNLRGGQIPEHH